MVLCYTDALSDNRDLLQNLVFEGSAPQLGHLLQQVNPNLSALVDVNSSLNQPSPFEHNWFKDGHVTSFGQ